MNRSASGIIALSAVAAAVAFAGASLAAVRSFDTVASLTGKYVGNNGYAGDALEISGDQIRFTAIDPAAANRGWVVGDIPYSGLTYQGQTRDGELRVKYTYVATCNRRVRDAAGSWAINSVPCTMTFNYDRGPNADTLMFSADKNSVRGIRRFPK